MKRTFFLTISVILFIPFKLLPSTVVRYISNIDGLTNNSVNCILEDSSHTMWIGTWDGLNAFDGRNIQTFRYSKSDLNTISNNIIRQIVEQDDWLWIATDNGINRLNKKSLRITRYYLQTDSKIPNQEKSFILGKRNGDIICCVRRKGLFLYQGQTDEFSPLSTDFGDRIKDFCIDGRGNTIFLLTDGTVKYLKGDLKKAGLRENGLQQVSMKQPVDKMFISGGHLILNGGSCLYFLKDDFSVQHEFVVERKKPVSEVIVSGKEAYIGFIEGGCVRYNLASDTYRPVEELPAQLSVFTLFRGSQNILWVGTDGQGLAQLYPYQSLFTTMHTSHPVRSFCECNKGMLLGTKGNGIMLLDEHTKQLKDYLSESNGLPSNSVYALNKNRSGDIFIGSEGTGINVLTHDGKLTQLDIPDKYPSFKAVYSIHFTHNDSLLWVGTSGYGLIKMEIVKKDRGYKVIGFRQYDSSGRNAALNNDVVYAITSTPDDRYLWFGTRGGGINRIDMANNKISNLQDINGGLLLTNNDILSLLYDGGSLWIGTSYGLNHLELKGEDFRLLPLPDRLSNRTIHGMLKDEKGNIWLSTNNGLFCLNPVTGKVDNYDMGDGLQNDEFSDGAYFQDAHHNLYFGGVSGVSYFNPGNIHLRKFTPTVVLSSLKIYDKLQNPYERLKDGVLQLSYNERFVTFTFTAKDFINNHNCEYAYRLNGHSDKWIYMGNKPEITFTELPPGEYRLEVKSTNGDRVWHNNACVLVFHIGNPWWLSLPAWMVYIALCLVLLCIVRSVIRNRMRLSRQVLLAQIEQQHEQKIYESRLNFFTDVAHEFFTPLTLIYTPAQHLLEQVGISDTQKRYLSIIKNNAERMQRLIHELLEFRNTDSENIPLHPINIEIGSFVKNITDSYIDILKEHKIDFKVNIHDTSTLYSDKNTLEKILFNLLSNAFKHTSRLGYISVEAFQSDAPGNVLHLSILNSGYGLTEQQMKEVFDRFKMFDAPHPDSSVSNGIGLHVAKSLVERLGGEIKVESKVGEYVKFSLTIPSLPFETQEDIVDKEITDIESPNREAENYKDKKILVAEGDEGIRKLLTDILSDYDVTEVGNGQEALAEIERTHPDIILTDLVMPHMDGLTLIDKLKSNPKTSYIPIIGISGRTGIEEQINAYNHGADAYITKPFYPRQIISTIENLLSRQDLLKEYFRSSLSSVKVKDGISLHPEDEAFIQSVTDYINRNIADESLNPNSIADFVGVSKATLYRKFKDIMDKTPSEFVRHIRLEYAARMLRETRLTVSEIMFKSGFSNKSYFYREFQKQYGLPPKDYRNR